MEKFKYNAETNEATFSAFDESVTISGISFHEANKLSMFLDMLVMESKNSALRDLTDRLYRVVDKR